MGEWAAVAVQSIPGIRAGSSAVKTDLQKQKSGFGRF